MLICVCAGQQRQTVCQARKAGLFINASKTQIMKDNGNRLPSLLNDKALPDVDHFTYLDTIKSKYGECIIYIKNMLGNAWEAISERYSWRQWALYPS